MDIIRPHRKPAIIPRPVASTTMRKPIHLGNEQTLFSGGEPQRARHKPQYAPRFSVWRRIFTYISGSIFVIGLAAVLFLLFKTIHISHTISFENTNETSFFADFTNATHTLFTHSTPLKQNENGRINILLLGRAGEHYPGQNLTDTIMLASIDTKTHQVALLSFPRDLYTPIGESENYTKINAIYQIGLNTKDGVQLLRQTVESITEETIQYSVIVDFDGFEKAIDAIGGISVDVPRDLLDTRYPGKNYSYETFEIQKGWHKLDGATTLKYVRERHADPEGDFGRAKRQQQVMQAIRDKAFSTGTFLNVFALSRLIDALGTSVKTDLTLDELDSFLSLLRTLDTKNITTEVIDAWKPESILRVSHIPTPSGNAFVLIPRTGNWKEVARIAHNIFTHDTLKQEKDHVSYENSSCLIIASSTQTDLASTLRRFLIDTLGFTTVSLATQDLENTPEHSTIQDTAQGTKPYSHNALLSRFEFEQIQNTSLSNTVSSPPADFILHIGNDLENSELLGETGTAPEEINTDILPPQKPQRKHGKR